MMATLQEGGTIERIWVGSGDTKEDAWKLARDFAAVLRALGIRVWLIQVRQVHRDLHCVELVRRES